MDGITSSDRQAVLRLLSDIVTSSAGGTITVTLPGGAVLTVSLPPGATPAPTAPTEASQNSHSEDFRAIRWAGVSYGLTPAQARVVALLWQAWEDGLPDVTQRRLLDAAGSTSERLSDLFRGSPAWGALVTAGGTKGTFRLG